jgi:hypothetical protein
LPIPGPGAKKINRRLDFIDQRINIPKVEGSGNERPMDFVEVKVMRDGAPARVTRVHCRDAEIVDLDPEAPANPFEVLATDEQMFVHAFMRTHGNIKKMEGIFNISYPTVKNRLAAIVRKLDAAFDVPASAAENPPPDPRAEILDRLARGELTFDEAMAQLRDV